MILKDDLIKTDPGDPNSIRYDRIAKKYEELSARLAEQARLDEEKHTKMLQEFEIVNKRILQTAKNLAKPPVEAKEPEHKTETRGERSERLRAEKQKFDPERYWLATKHGI